MQRRTAVMQSDIVLSRSPLDELVEIQRISSEDMESYRNHLRGVIREHISETGSEWAEHILENFDDYIGRFWLVKPKAANLRSLLASTRARPE